MGYCGWHPHGPAAPRCPIRIPRRFFAVSAIYNLCLGRGIYNRVLQWLLWIDAILFARQPRFSVRDLGLLQIGFYL